MANMMVSRLREQFDALEASRAVLLKELAGVDPQLWVQAPRPASWSLAEIAHHLMLAEEEVLRQLRKPEANFRRRQTLRDLLGRALVRWIFRRGIPVKTPMRSMEPTPGRSLEEIRHAWDRVRSELAFRLVALHNGESNGVVFQHPVAGRMTIAQTLELIRAHFDDHLRQVAQTVGALTNTLPPSSTNRRKPHTIRMKSG